ncbi:MAG: hypothetical protein HKO96_09700 [Flavobacteriaceae bacterium]|nr:hypothetical protein [Bacteroidia bacterium]NNK70740.1 hypothetical protein [Flavobacteriaceae bacterium]
MKNINYALLVLFGIFFSSCSVEEMDTTSELAYIDLNANDVKDNTRTTSTSIKCLKKNLFDADGTNLGVLIFTVRDEDVKIRFKTEGDFKFTDVNLSLKRLNLNELDNFANETPVDADFNHKAVLQTKNYRYDFIVDKTQLGMYNRLAAHAILESDKGEVKDVWTEGWNSFILADFSYCGEWPNAEYISSTEDIQYFAPLTAGTSGDYPDTGTSSDTVSLTSENPVTEGYVDIPLHFSDIPEGYKSVTLSIDFKDLDLHTDVLTSGSNVVEFKETFILMDSGGKIIAELNENHESDGDFTWEYEIPDYVITEVDYNDPYEDGLTLYARIGASLNLTNGNGVTVKNTIESIENMTLSGDLVIK